MPRVRKDRQIVPGAKVRARVGPLNHFTSPGGRRARRWFTGLVVGSGKPTPKSPRTWKVLWFECGCCCDHSPNSLHFVDRPAPTFDAKVYDDLLNEDYYENSNKFFKFIDKETFNNEIRFRTNYQDPTRNRTNSSTAENSTANSQDAPSSEQGAIQSSNSPSNSQHDPPSNNILLHQNSVQGSVSIAASSFNPPSTFGRPNNLTALMESSQQSDPLLNPTIDPALFRPPPVPAQAPGTQDPSNNSSSSEESNTIVLSTSPPSTNGAVANTSSSSTSPPTAGNRSSSTTSSSSQTMLPASSPSRTNTSSQQSTSSSLTTTRASSTTSTFASTLLLSESVATGAGDNQTEVAETVEDETEEAGTQIDKEFEEPNLFDPNEIVRDILSLENQSGDKYVRWQRKAKREKEEQIGKEVVVGPANKKVKWTVIRDVKRSEVKRVVQKFVKTGIHGIDFSHKKVPVNALRKKFRPDLCRLLRHLWPGNWKAQLKYVNKVLDEERRKLEKESRRGKGKRVYFPRKISEREFWVFFGILLCGRVEGSNVHLWTDPENFNYEDEGYVKKGLNLGAKVKMTKSRFDEIKKAFWILFADETLEGSDDWWRVMAGINGFNENRKRTIMSPNTKVLDETMSAFAPQKTPTGNLPHLSHIPRKPEPLGTEFKTVAACGGLGE